MAGTVTVTGTTGPGLTATATIITGVTSVQIDMVNNILTVYSATFQPDPQVFAITSATTITATKSGSTYTLTIS